ncbi:MAG: GIY-YIG nuclease family protein [Gammaproteobacteria bacterium]|nr:MAG: GIY-YIG nuclease family protein [Chloroflexota bacterium]TDJ22782.1 MAG: GIY-YIG nuclease family protein [Gammaproteobacteria bacterium]TDJ41134.1 MAG: GIY-YIG nuclease family protein [Gammaproteobacteria bacterium]
MDWSVYIIRADDGSLYTGVTTDVERRFAEHRAGRGAKYFRGRQPIAVVYQEAGHTRSSACIRESEIKKMPRADKSRLLVRCAAVSPGYPGR